MGRPEAPIDRTIPALGKAAEILRSMRHSAGLTYAELAVRANYSAAHLKRAASGQWASADVFEAYAWACATGGADYYLMAEVRHLHCVAAKAIQAAKQMASRRSTVVPKPQYASDEADLSRAMRDAWARAARPTCRQIETVSRKQVPRSTANAITKGHTLPKDLRQYVAFLNTCEISDDALAPWFRAWVKVRGVPKDKERRLALGWMKPTVARLYLTAVLTAAQDQLDAGSPLTGFLRSVVSETQRALYKVSYLTSASDWRFTPLAPVTGESWGYRTVVRAEPTGRIAA